MKNFNIFAFRTYSGSLTHQTMIYQNLIPLAPSKTPNHFLQWLQWGFALSYYVLSSLMQFSFSIPDIFYNSPQLLLINSVLSIPFFMTAWNLLIRLSIMEERLKNFLI